MLELLRGSPLLVLFLVAAIGFLIGRIKLGGTSLGVAAVLFVGLGFGAFDASLALPEVVQLLGLVIFVYAIGVASGPGFFSLLRRRGLRDNGLALGVLVAGAALCAAVGSALGLRAPSIAGAFAGALTNTPALASVIEALKSRTLAGAAPDVAPVLAYSVTYPIGVVGVIAALWLADRIWSGGPGKPVRVAQSRRAHSLDNVTVRIRSTITASHAKSLFHVHNLPVMLGRWKHGATMQLVTGEITFEEGDLVTLVGVGADLASATELLGARSDERIDLDRHILDFRRMFVSRSDAAEKPLSVLRIPERFGAVLTRVRRGEVEFVPTGATELELGDRVRVLAPRERMEQVASFFGDSYRALAEVDVLTFGLGVALGLLLGSVPLPLPGGGVFKLGLAGGPLVVGLLLGRVGRTGPLVWTLSYSASLTLRQFGLVLFLAAVGTRAGSGFLTTMQHGGITIMLAGALVTCAVALTFLVIGWKVFKIPSGVLMGMVAGLHTQPAALAFATERTKDDTPNVGYATVFPVAMIAKIVLAQALLFSLR